MRRDWFSLGDKDLAARENVAFFCSRQVAPSALLNCYDWAIAQRELGRCVISGFHSRIEKDVLYYLLKGSQPIVIALHRGIGPKIAAQFKKEIDAGRLLIISPFDESVKRGDRRTARTRNEMMLEMADSITVGYASPGGELEKLLNTVDKPIEYLWREDDNHEKSRSRIYFVDDESSIERIMEDR